MKIPHAGHLVLAASALIAMAGSAIAQRTPCDSPCKLLLLPLITPNDQPIYSEYQVDKPVMAVRGSPSPVYPHALKVWKIEGEVVVAFVVDTTGKADVNTLRILKSTDVLFTEAVKVALPQMRFVPAELRGAKVRQLVQQPFVFNIAK